MSTGRSSAERQAKLQRRLIADQRRETQKAMAEEKDIERENIAGLKRRQGGRMSLIEQQNSLQNKLGVS